MQRNEDRYEYGETRSYFHDVARYFAQMMYARSTTVGFVVVLASQVTLEKGSTTVVAMSDQGASHILIFSQFFVRPSILK